MGVVAAVVDGAVPLGGEEGGEWREERLSTLNAPAVRLVYARQIGSATGGNPSPFPDVSQAFPSLHHFISPSTQPAPPKFPSRRMSQKKPGLASLMPSRRASQGSRHFPSSGSPPFGANLCAELKIPFKENAGWVLYQQRRKGPYSAPSDDPDCA